MVILLSKILAVLGIVGGLGSFIYYTIPRASMQRRENFVLMIQNISPILIQGIEKKSDFYRMKNHGEEQYEMNCKIQYVDYFENCSFFVKERENKYEQQGKR